VVVARAGRPSPRLASATPLRARSAATALGDRPTGDDAARRGRGGGREPHSPPGPSRRTAARAWRVPASRSRFSAGPGVAAEDRAEGRDGNTRPSPALGSVKQSTAGTSRPTLGAVSGAAGPRIFRNRCRRRRRRSGACGSVRCERRPFRGTFPRRCARRRMQPAGASSGNGSRLRGSGRTPHDAPAGGRAAAERTVRGQTIVPRPGRRVPTPASDARRGGAGVAPRAVTGPQARGKFSASGKARAALRDRWTTSRTRGIPLSSRGPSSGHADHLFLIYSMGHA
jgi:hypothetical protein